MDIDLIPECVETPSDPHDGYAECVCTDGLGSWRDSSTNCNSPIPLRLSDPFRRFRMIIPVD